MPTTHCRFQPALSGLACLGILAVVVACGGSSEESGGGDPGLPEYATTAATGKINTKDWAFYGGRVMNSSTDASRQEFTLVSNVTAKPCDDFVLVGTDKRAIIWYQNNITTGETLLSQDPTKSMSVTLYDSSQGIPKNYIAFEGKISLDEVSTASVKGKIYASYDDTTYVNGTFTLARCCHIGNLMYEVCK